MREWLKLFEGKEEVDPTVVEEADAEDTVEEAAADEAVEEGTDFSFLRSIAEQSNPLATAYHEFMAEADFINDQVPGILRGNLTDDQGNQYDDQGNMLDDQGNVIDQAQQQQPGNATTAPKPTGNAAPTPAVAAGSGQSNSTVKPGAPAAPTGNAAPAPAAAPSGPAPVLNPAQQQAKAAADAQRANANRPK